MKDKLQISIMPGGIIKITSEGEITAGAIHTSAENVIRAIRENAGGPSRIEHLKGHGHLHCHQHGGQTHQH